MTQAGEGGDVVYIPGVFNYSKHAEIYPANLIGLLISAHDEKVTDGHRIPQQRPRQRMPALMPLP